MSNNHAPGRPGAAPTWCTSDKDLVTTSLGASQVWATLGRGVLNEIYWPSTGRPQTRDLTFIVAKDDQWWDVKRINSYEATTPEPYILLPTVRHSGEEFTLTLKVTCDDLRDVVLVRYELEGAGHRLYCLLAPRLGAPDAPNSAWCDQGAMFARGEGHYLCFRCDNGFDRASVGYVGESDGWQDFHRHGRMTQAYDRADEGHVALMGELAGESGTLAVGFALSDVGSATLARSSLAEGFESIRERVARRWRQWRDDWHPPSELDRQALNQVEHCAAVIKTCEDRLYPGAVVASLSVPWGNARTGRSGYHYIWPRDSVEAGLGMLAVGHFAEVRRLAAYLIAAQQPEGHWQQNFWPDGTAHWRAVQLDQTAFPVILVAKLAELGELGGLDDVGVMVQRALGFLVRFGPVSEQDRWEQSSGVSIFALALMIAALAGGAQLIDDERLQQYLLSYADYLNSRVEDWLYVQGTELCRKYDVPGYYIRLAKSSVFTGDHGQIEVDSNKPPVPAALMPAIDFAYLVRLGLRDAHDPRCRASLRATEGELRVETPSGPSFYRFHGDEYGEHDDGAPFDGSGRGRLWPLLTGERGHLAVDLGEDAAIYFRAMASMAGRCGLIPEQIWDADPIPEKNLYPGKPTGSAMPLLWAHAEIIKLAMTIATGEPAERLRSVRERYQRSSAASTTWHWRSDCPFDCLPAGKDLLIEAPFPFLLHYGWDDWHDVADRDSEPLGVGMQGVRLPHAAFAGRALLNFTMLNRSDGTWGQDYSISLDADAEAADGSDAPSRRRDASRPMASQNAR